MLCAEVPSQSLEEKTPLKAARALVVFGSLKKISQKLHSRSLAALLHAFGCHDAELGDTGRELEGVHEHQQTFWSPP